MRDDKAVSKDTTRRSKEEIGHFSASRRAGEFDRSPLSLVASVSQDTPRFSFLGYRTNSLRSTNDGSYPALLRGGMLERALNASFLVEIDEFN